MKWGHTFVLRLRLKWGHLKCLKWKCLKWGHTFVLRLRLKWGHFKCFTSASSGVTPSFFAGALRSTESLDGGYEEGANRGRIGVTPSFFSGVELDDELGSHLRSSLMTRS